MQAAWGPQVEKHGAEDPEVQEHSASTCAVAGVLQMMASAPQMVVSLVTI